MKKYTAIFALMFAMTGISPAFAHAFLTRSVPAVGSTVAAPPARLVLSYTEDLEIPFCSVVVTDAAGAEVQTSKPLPVPGHGDEMQVKLHITAPGKYKVTWHALSVDTHKTQGSFSFSVRA